MSRFHAAIHSDAFVTDLLEELAVPETAMTSRELHRDERFNNQP